MNRAFSSCKKAHLHIKPKIVKTLQDPSHRLPSKVEIICAYDEFSCQPFPFQPRGDRGAGSPGSLQDPHRHVSPGYGGGQSEALVPRQQVSITSYREKIVCSLKSETQSGSCEKVV